MNKLKACNLEGNLLTCSMVQERFNLGRQTVMQIAKNNGCILKFGKAVRIDAEAFEKALESYRV